MSKQSVLIVDDEPDIRELLEITLLRMGLITYSAINVEEAILSLQQNKPDLCLTDMKLPDGTGIDIVRYINNKMPHVPVAVITAFGSMDTAVSALKSGAYDFVSKPVDLKKLRELIATALEHSKKNSQAKPATKLSTPRHLANNPLIFGSSAPITQLLSTINKLGKSHAPVYINGESGSGKELVAKSIHMSGPHKGAPFIPVNCGAIPENLVESEFFGHIKGSFSGAIADKKGLFEAANGGTLFLDEVADLPLEMQVKLLRAIQEHAVKPVGGVQEIAVNVRILSATHKSLEDEVLHQRFREDLYYRLNVIKLEVPPLRVRGDDIMLLAHKFLDDIASRWGLDNPQLSTEAKDALLNYSFPGNVRELINILERACTLSDNGIITIKDLQLPAIRTSIEPNITEPTKRAPLEIPSWEKGSYSAKDERNVISQTLEQTQWNRTKAAEVLGMTLRQLRYRIKKYKLDVSDHLF
ncbi:MAG: sigma-54-dependent Fis family transcriptional regulator [Thiotrichaceae bacterium]|nr:sigma-54-dependent Fis family transcriptional regulator [Thiotrichaceae bacterium]